MHASNQEEMLFHDIEASYSYLSQFANITDELAIIAVFLRCLFSQGKPPENVCEKELATCKLVILVEDDWYKVSLIYGLAYEESLDGFTLPYISKIQISTSHRWQNWKWYRRKLEVIENFLCLAVGGPIYPIGSFVGKVVSRLQEHPNNKEVEIFDTSVRKPSKKCFPNMLFTLNDIKQGEYLKNWLKEFETEVFKSIVSLYTAHYYRELYVENRFSMMVQALEAYHRYKYDGKYIPDKEYREGGLYNSICRVIDE
ncbi:MAG: hypothetical protein K6U00_08065, partial [Armatimonadetes bacterium]|nr:hypothetical protein [Armatimonadota bacterium]